MMMYMHRVREVLLNVVCAWESGGGVLSGRPFFARLCARRADRASELSGGGVRSQTLAPLNSLRNSCRGSSLSCVHDLAERNQRIRPQIGRYTTRASRVGKSAIRGLNLCLVRLDYCCRHLCPRRELIQVLSVP